MSEVVNDIKIDRKEEIMKMMKIFIVMFVFSLFLGYVYGEDINEKPEVRREKIEKVLKSSVTNEDNLKEWFKDKDPIVREKAAIETGKKKTNKARDILLENIKSNDYELRIASIEGLKNFKKDKKVINTLIFLLKDEEKNIRWKAVEVLGDVGDDSAVKPISNLIKKESDEYIKRTAIEALGKIGTQKAIDELMLIKNGKNKELSTMAANVLKAIDFEKKRNLKSSTSTKNNVQSKNTKKKQ